MDTNYTMIPLSTPIIHTNIPFYMFSIHQFVYILNLNLNVNSTWFDSRETSGDEKATHQKIVDNNIGNCCNYGYFFILFALI